VATPYPTCYLDGEYLPLAEARISPLDRGFLFADGVYEVVPVHRGRPFRLREHLKRLDDSLRGIRVSNPMDESGWTAMLQRLAAEAAAPELLVYLQVTRGAEYGRNHLFPKDAKPTAFAFASPYPEPSAATLEQGLSAVTLEGSSSSVFLCVGGTLVTPPNSHRILPGTSRDAVLELAAGWLPCEVCDVEARDIASCDEVWIASAGRGVLPVTSVDTMPVGSGRPGPLWSEMYARLQQHLDDISSAPAI
jgi:D-alanine transaminase